MVRHLREIWNDIDLHYSLLYRITTNVTWNVINLKIIELTVIRFLPVSQSVSHRNCFNLLKVRDLSLLNTTLSLQLSFSAKIKWYAFIHFHKTPLQLSILLSILFINFYHDIFAQEIFKIWSFCASMISLISRLAKTNICFICHLSDSSLKYRNKDRPLDF